MEGEPCDRLTTLKCSPGHRAAKRFRADGTAEPYDAGGRFRARSVPIHGIDDLAAKLTELSGLPDQLVIRGEPIHGPDAAVPRRKNGENAAFREQARRWVCLDIDDPAPPEGRSPTDRAAVEWAIDRFLPDEFRDISFVVQWSNSAGLSDKIKAHLWFLLEEPVADKDLEDTIHAWNQAYFGDDWRNRNEGPHLVDPATCRTVQPNYTAAPVFDNPAHDPFASRSRVELVRRSRDRVRWQVRRPDDAPRRAGEAAQSPQASDAASGRAASGREEQVRAAIWRVTRDHVLRDRDDAVARVIKALDADGFQWGQPPGSDNNITHQWVTEKVHADNAVRRALERDVVTLDPPRELDADSARASLGFHLAQFVRNGGRTAIKGAAGLGKSTALAEQLSRNLKAGSYVEIYVPTSEEVTVVADRLAAYGLDARPIHGRRWDNCDESMWPFVEAAGKAGHPVEESVCKRCPIFKECAYYQQDPDHGPAVRVMPHAKLHQNRATGLAAPDLMVVDETLIPEVAGSVDISKDDLINYKPNMEKLDHILRDLFTKDDGPEPPDPNDLQKLSNFLLDAHKNIQNGRWFFDGYSIADLKSLYDAANTFRDKEVFSKALDLKEVFKKIQSSFLLQHKRVMQMLKFAYEDLAQFGEPRRFRQDAPVRSDDAMVRLLWRKEPAKFTGAHNFLLLDADLQQDIVDRYGAGAFDVIELPARRDCTVIAITDHNLSRSKMLDKKGALTKIGREMVEFADKHADGLISYKAVREAVVGAPRKQRVSETAGGTKVAHFGFLRGTNALEGCQSLAVLGRQCSGDAVADIASALFWDDCEPVSREQGECYYRRRASDGSECVRLGRRWADPRCRTVEDATDHAESRQAVDRGRWIGSSGTVYLLTAAPVPGLRIDHFATWRELKAAGKLAAMVDWYGGALPLSSRLLARDGWFTSEQAVKDWSENEWLNRIRGVLIRLGHSFSEGRYRASGQKGARPGRFIARAGIDVGAALESALEASLNWYEIDETYGLPDHEPEPEPEAEPESAPAPNDDGGDSLAPRDLNDAYATLQRIFGPGRVECYRLTKPG